VKIVNGKNVNESQKTRQKFGGKKRGELPSVCAWKNKCQTHEAARQIYTLAFINEFGLRSKKLGVEMGGGRDLNRGFHA